jgi:uncharacterized membrane protein
VTFTAPAFLWLLLAVPLVWLAPVFARTNFNRRQRRLQAVIRSLLLAAVALALARPIISTASSRQSIVYVVDVSHSISSRAIEAAAGTIDEINGTLRPAHSRVVAFGGIAATLADTGALRRLAQIEAPSGELSAAHRRATDLEAALDAGRAELAPGHVPRLVLFSDGHATAGDTAAAIARLARSGVPVSIHPLAVRSLGDAWIDSLTVPDRIVAGAPFTATVAVGSQRDAAAIVEVRSAGNVIAKRPVLLSQGTSHVPLDAVLDVPGAAMLQAALTLTGDPLSTNNTLDRSVWAETRTKVLYVEGAPASARYLSAALGESGFDVTVRPAAALPSAAADLDAWDAVILSDVSRTAIRDGSMAALSDWVEQRGGGLLVAGGESVFGERGYRRSPLERLTPVTFERKDEPEVALVLVLDRSWSMAGLSMELCKAAAQAAVDVLADEQSVGILTFNDAFNWDVTLRNVGQHRNWIRRQIAAIGPGGHTLIFPAVDQAYRALKPAKARAKHVVLLSDGRSYPANYEDLLRQMVEARITVSAIAVGPAADPELLGNIAKWGKGRYYAVSDAKELPQIFVKEAKDASTPAFDERAITPVVKNPAFLVGVDLAHVPPLKGRTATVLKDTALELLATDDEDPLLAFWPIGSGRVAVFASDVKDRWAADWVSWRGYGPFFASVVRAVERRRPPAAALDIVAGPIRGQARSIAVGLETRAADGRYRDLLNPRVQVSAAGGKPAPIPLRQVMAGRYEATIVADARQVVTFAATASDPGTTSIAVVPDTAAEYRFRPPDEGLLRGMATATGGAWMPTAATLANSPDDRRTERRQASTAFIVLALVLWFADIVMRRIRIFEA